MSKINKKYQCNLCDKNFSRPFALKRHLATIHKIEDLFKSQKTKCIICKIDVSSSSYNDHLEKIHEIKINKKVMHFENEKGKFLRNLRTIIF